MELTQERMFAMYGKAVAENVILRAQIEQLKAALQAQERAAIALREAEIEPEE